MTLLAVATGPERGTDHCDAVHDQVDAHQQSDRPGGGFGEAIGDEETENQRHDAAYSDESPARHLPFGDADHQPRETTDQMTSITVTVNAPSSGAAIR